MPYRSEARLVRDFVRFLSSGDDADLGATHVAREFDYQRGRTDVVALGVRGAVLAFEAKLARWRDALHQAYRNRCFAHRTYVVVPMAVGERLMQHEAEFRRRKVGLCAVRSADDVAVLIESDAGEPWQPWLSEEAAAEASRGRACKRQRTSRGLPA